MKPLLELYSLADPIFFEDPVRWRSEETTFPLVSAQPPPGWVRTVNGVWVGLRPDGNRLPDQGWKIHVTATPDNADRALDLVSRYCFERSIQFKFLCTGGVALAYNLKYAPRASSGKLITIYPVDDEVLAECLVNLDEVLRGMPGPYILSDLRWSQGPLFVRYGGFTTRYCTSAAGERVLAIEGPDGVLVPDERRPVFTVPSWVGIPEFLKPHVEARNAPSGEFGYQIVEALHFSNGGGVYLARRLSDGQEVVLKEARPLAGLDGTGTDALTRLGNEELALRKLDGIPGVPRLHEVVQVWEHRFLVMDRIPGTTLQSWLALHFPLIGMKSTQRARREYLARAEAILAKVGGLVGLLHERGVVFGDLHPANVLVDDNDDVGLVDFESAFDGASGDRPGMGHAGFATKTKTGFAVDLHALAVLRLWLLMPLTSLIGLAPGKIEDLITAAEQNFELPSEFGHTMREQLGTTADTALTRPSPDLWNAERPDWSAVRASMVAAIRASATPDRDDRLFPCDIEGFLGDGRGFAYGAAGVLWALSVTGAPREERYEQWLLNRLARPSHRAGFYDGLHGIAYLLAHLGYHEESTDLVDRAKPLVREMRDVTVFSGMAGVGLNLVELKDVGSALELADRLTTALDSGQPHGVDVPPGQLGRAKDAGTHGGLLRGWSGVALFFLRLYEATGDRGLLANAVRALHRDLDLCVPGEDGSLQVDGGFRMLPYLEVGSAGIAVVAAEVLGHEHDQRLRDCIEPITRASRSPFVVEPQLFKGRSGLMAMLARIARSGTAEVPASALTEHLANLRWHAVGYQGQLAFPGDGCFRLSMDLATGSAGVLVGLASTVDGNVPMLPFLAHTQNQVAAPDGRGDHSGVRESVTGVNQP